MDNSAVSALFAGSYCRSKEKKGLLIKCILAFSVISFGLFFIDLAVVSSYATQNLVCHLFSSFLSGLVEPF
jgi:hypothetical protein